MFLRDETACRQSKARYRTTDIVLGYNCRCSFSAARTVVLQGLSGIQNQNQCLKILRSCFLHTTNRRKWQIGGSDLLCHFAKFARWQLQQLFFPLLFGLWLKILTIILLLGLMCRFSPCRPVVCCLWQQFFLWLFHHTLGLGITWIPVLCFALL